MPFLCALATLPDIVAVLAKGRSQQEHGYLAIARELLGDRAGAEAALEEYAAAAQTQLPPMSTQSWRFVRSFLDHFGLRKETLSLPVGS
jgi:hypothetical protein